MSKNDMNDKKQYLTEQPSNSTQSHTIAILHLERLKHQYEHINTP